jgi:hypothetical protein
MRAGGALSELGHLVNGIRKAPPDSIFCMDYCLSGICNPEVASSAGNRGMRIPHPSFLRGLAGEAEIAPEQGEKWG